MDLDSDGLPDVISASDSGELYLFPGERKGRFAAGEPIAGENGEVIKADAAYMLSAADWDGDGDFDLLLGTGRGAVLLLANQGSPRRYRFGKPQPLVAQGEPIVAPEGDAAPIAADWDGDGRHDLILGARDGSVWWYRNVATSKEPELAAGECLVPKSPSGSADDQRRAADDWGTSVKPCAADFNGDGRLDLLVGDSCGGFEAKPSQTADEVAEELQAIERLPAARREWAKAFGSYRKLLAASDGDDATEGQQQELHELLSQVQRLKEEIARAQATIKRYEPCRQRHGFVWLFLRKGLPP